MLACKTEMHFLAKGKLGGKWCTKCRTLGIKGMKIV